MHRLGHFTIVLSLMLSVGAALWIATRGARVQASTAPTSANLDWPFFGNDLSNSRYQNADQINTTNATNLQVAWVFHTGVFDNAASLEVSPIVVNGTMYVTDGHDDLFALDATNGQQRWAYKPTLLTDFSQLSICCGRVNRGAAFGNGKVYEGRLDDVVVALNAADGSVSWTTTVVDFHDRYAITMAPQFVPASGGRPNLLIVGVSGGEYKVRGQVVALNADNGVEVWRYFTTSAAPAVKAATWAGNSWKTGGATLWNTPAVDPDLGLVYINTSNAAPDINGATRDGKNLNSSSIVALDLASGQQRWAFQEVHHDLWDYDSAQPVMLFTVTQSGQALPALGECSKNGNYYILDRRSGTPIYPVTEVPAPTDPAWQHAWPTQPESAVEPLTPVTILPGTVDMTKLPKGVQLGSRYAVPQQQTLLIVPGDDGGCEWAPAAFSPRTGFVYYGTRYEPTTYSTFPDNQGPDGGGLFLGSAFEGQVPGVTDFGLFGATDTATGKVVWKIQVAQPAKSGMLVAGDVAFFGEGNGKFHAVNASSGQNLWTFDGTTLPGGGGAQASPAAYVVNGREFVVNAFGGNTADQAEFPPNPVGDAIVAFALPQ